MKSPKVPKLPRPVTVDFETEKIVSRPFYPPKPVGVSIKLPGKKAKYYAFGHPTKNNCTREQAVAALAKVWKNKDGLLFQNGKFDVDVAEVHFGLPIPEWDKIHDSMFLLFLDDPHQKELGLKPSSERLLGTPPEEQDAVGEWLMQHQPVEGVKISRSKSSEHYFGAYISYAPGDLVGTYANGDTERTEALFNLLWPKTVERGMLEAYDRERKLMPILLEMERQGVPVDLNRLRHDVKVYNGWRDKVNAWILKRLKADSTLNLDSGAQLVDAMIAAKVVDVDKMPLTPTGKYQTNKEALLLGVTDKVLLGMLKYRTQLSTCLNTFMQPWLKVAEASGGLIFTTWNQVKAPKGDNTAGTRTGRLSSTPNFQNMVKELQAIFAQHEKDLKKAKKLAKCPLVGLPTLPLVRSYIVPFKGEVFIDRDYCFGPGTEVLTEKGFRLFEDLGGAPIKLAQWKNGVITYDFPKELQANHFTGDLVNIVGSRSTDLLVTPNHQCLIAKDNFTLFTRADEYPVGHYRQLHAGTYSGVFHMEVNQLRLAVAVQADSTVKSSSIAWKLKKIRKVKRLHKLLTDLNLEFSVSTPPSTPGYSITYLKNGDIPDWLKSFIDLETKTFKREIIYADPVARLAFLTELAYWDGRRNLGGKSWAYFTANEFNANLAQELAAITGLRSVMHKQVLPSEKIFTTVALRFNYATWTSTYTSTNVPYDGLVHCATMPHGTLIVRRNGRVMVTGNSQQEPRILAHFEDGALKDAYLANPWIDYHDNAKAHLEKVLNRPFDRKPVKNVNLGIIYGQGIASLAVKNDSSVQETKELKNLILGLYPGLKDMYKDMKQCEKDNIPIHTWGGREYYCEPPKLFNGRMMHFDYKLVNVLVQGSAADCTKEAIIRYHAAKPKHHKLVLNVHDQLIASVPKKEVKMGMEIMRATMESVEFDVPILSEGSTSHTNWAELKDYDKKGKLLKP